MDGPALALPSHARSWSRTEARFIARVRKVTAPRSGSRFPPREVEHGHSLPRSDDRPLHGFLGIRTAVRVSCAGAGGEEMNGLYVLGFVVTVLLAVYLFAALLKPERF